MYAGSSYLARLRLQKRLDNNVIKCAGAVNNIKASIIPGGPSNPSSPSLTRQNIQQDRLKRAADRRDKKRRASLKPIPTQRRRINEIMEDPKTEDHIFSKDHIKKGILNLGKNRKKIRNFITSKIFEAYKKEKLVNGSNQILTKVNGRDCTLRIFVENGNVKFFNAMPDHATRSLGNTFYL